MATVTGGSGNDSLAGTTGWDTIYGGAGNDTVTANSGDDSVFGGSGTDLVYSGDGNDVVLGGTGSDTVYGDLGNDSLLGNSGIDVIYGGSGMDVLLGESGNDTLDGGSENDRVEGGTGSDSLIGGGGSDTLSGDGSNINTPYFASTGAIDTTITISNAASFSIDVYWINTSGVGVYYTTITSGGSWSQPTGSTHNWYVAETGQTAILDLILGAPNQSYTLTPDFNDTLDGGAGDDSISGGYGADSILAGDGNDTVTGGVGNDTVFGGLGSDNVTLGDGNDSFGSWSDDGGNDTVYGGLGNDNIIGGGENDIVDGGEGDDTLSGGVGSDSAYGGGGSDAFLVTDDHEADYLDGGETGSDFDVIYFSNYLTTAGVTVTFNATGAGGYDFDASVGYGSFVGIEAIGGTDYADILNAGADAGGIQLYGNAGNDSITGGGGNDTLYGGIGADTIYFGAGADTVYGGDGDDWIDDVSTTNNVGATLVYGGTGNDHIWSGGGNDTVYGEDGADAIDAEAGDDLIFGGLGNDTLSGSDGNDTVDGGAGTDVIYGGLGNDSLLGGSENDALYGDAGNDVLSGDAGNDSLYGGADSDRLVLNANDGIDLIAGGETGTDRDILQLTSALNEANTVVFTGSEAGTYTYAGGGSGTFSQIEVIETAGGNDSVNASAASAPVEVYGGSGQDTLTGGSGADTLSGGDGNDQLTGGTGNDVLSGDGGTDQIFIGWNDGIDSISGGETGSDYDFLSFGTGSAGLGVKVTFSGAEAGTYSYAGGGSGSFTGIEEVDGTSGADTLDGSLAATGISLKGGGGDDSILGSATNDFLQGDDGNDSVFGGGGNDTLNGDAGNDVSYGGVGDDWLLSGQGNNQSFGGDGHDYLFDGSGASLLDGGAGNDTIYGSGGNDTLIGGAGNDTMTGADDQDSFIITDGFGIDTIVGGEGGVDYDTADMSAVTGPISVTFDATGAGTISQGSNAISFGQIEKLVLGAGADVIYAGADSGGIAIDAAAGDDTAFGGAGADTVYGGDGSDSLSGGAGSDRLYGDAGADTLLGNAGEDLLYGGAGADRFAGGAGDDALYTGDGADQVDLISGGGSDTIYDFDLTRVGTATTDQLDVSDLRTLDGQPLHARDVGISADGSGNAVLTFPQGEQVTLVGVAPADVTGKQALASIGVPCFTRGTRILTPTGERLVEDLRSGDLVQTLDDGAQPILWCGSRWLGTGDLAARPDLCPVLIRDGALGNHGDLLVSPQHALLIATDQGARLVRARHLAQTGDGRFRVARGRREVGYHHLLLPHHAVIFANGAGCESLYPGPHVLRALGPQVCAQMLAFVPRLGPVISGSKATFLIYGPLARPMLPRQSVQRLERLVGPQFACNAETDWQIRRGAFSVTKRPIVTKSGC